MESKCTKYQAFVNIFLIKNIMFHTEKSTVSRITNLRNIKWKFEKIAGHFNTLRGFLKLLFKKLPMAWY